MIENSARIKYTQETFDMVFALTWLSWNLPSLESRFISSASLKNFEMSFSEDKQFRIQSL